MSGSLHDDAAARSARLRQRLWGAAVLIAALVIVLPLLLDGAGSESQFRRVERLREEPPRVLGPDGAPEPGDGGSVADVVPRIRIGEDDPPDYLRDGPAGEGTTGGVGPGGAAPGTAVAGRAPAPPPVSDDAPAAWVVQAGSFGDEANALAVRDRLRRAGYPSFLGSVGAAGPFRVRVGPMIERARADAVRGEVVRLLGREAIVTGYP